ncbi:hypothetical protein IMG5_172090 [Ichthyophthirius multifiliis]|uniref:CSC1/OSCA1-like cytosolic domain-containing protein n=1 Tax=Ichthyophthirius multifiliis TaxID=5932 RepID=G0R1Q2_ICHMU|nr:hypothetical protein IMG5_172090 [Ichthyophthirius multifiliis]EGR28597.1 hypothetical protein IMG5_172090 [Ichthyophthirius multifiliis]|eukprot:XP_004029833.1 hypothetical protein IMG5_172090 [Ichthyophthirius multifiliis]
MQLGKANKFGLPEPFNLNCDINEFKDYGIGLFFFFSFIKIIAIFFLMASLIALPSLYSNYTGKGLDVQGINILQQFSIANQPQLIAILPSIKLTDEQKNQLQKQNDDNVQTFVNEMNTRKYYLWIPDIVYSCLFLIIIFYYRIFSIKQLRAYNELNIFPSRYALEVKGFPKSTKDPNDLKFFLNGVFQIFQNDDSGSDVVVEVAFARNFHGTLYLHQQEALLLERNELDDEKKKLGLLNRNQQLILKRNKQKLKEIQDKMNEIIQKKLNGNIQYEEYETIKAYVVFQTFEYRKKAFQMYEKYTNPHWVFKYLLCCFRPKMPYSMKFNGKYELKFSENTDLPSNIKWENLDIQKSIKIYIDVRYIKRQIVAFFTILIVMSLTIFIVIVANIVRPENPECVIVNMNFEQVQKQNDTTITKCFCIQQDITDIAQDTSLRNFCWNQYTQHLFTMALIILSSFIIIFVNILLRIIVKKLSKYLRFPTFSQESSVTAVLLFICTFINTAIIVLILQADIFGFILSIFITNPIPPLKELQEQKKTNFSSDFTRIWYKEVGSKIVFTMLLTTISPHLINALLIPIKRCILISRAKKAVLQQEMNKIIIGPEFDLVPYYASVLNVTFTCMLYSSGQPILLFFGFISLFIQYWCYKYQLLRFNQKPPQYDQQVNNTIIKIIPLCLVLHLAVGMYMYGQPLIFPQDSNQVKVIVLDSLNSEGYNDVQIFQDQNDIIQKRAFNIIYLFYFLCFLIIFLVFDIIVYPIIKFFFLSDNKKSNQVISKEVSNILSYNNQLNKMRLKMIVSYDMQKNPTYGGIVEAINDGSSKYSNSPKGSIKIQNFAMQGVKQNINKKSMFGQDSVQNQGNKIQTQER